MNPAANVLRTPSEPEAHDNADRSTVPRSLGISDIPNQNGPRDSSSQKPFLFNYSRR
jgi:hypothetical protein